MSPAERKATLERFATHLRLEAQSWMLKNLLPIGVDASSAITLAEEAFTINANAVRGAGVSLGVIPREPIE